jgi:ligand-binding sensor domain-containing protein
MVFWYKSVLCCERIFMIYSEYSNVVQVRRGRLLLRRCCVLCFAVLLHIVVMFTAWSQPSSFHSSYLRFEHISLERGLSQSTVQCALQDRRGFMWFGTEDGLNRFDGYQFLVYRHKVRESGSIPDNDIRALHEHPTDGTLWIGTYNAALCSFNPVTEKFVSYSPFVQMNPAVLSLAAESNVLWVGTSKGLHCFDTDKRRWVLFPCDTVYSDALRQSSIAAVCTDENHVLWVGTNTGLYALNTETGSVRVYQTSHQNRTEAGLPDNTVSALYKDRAGLLWVGTRHGVVSFDKHQHRFVSFESFAGKQASGSQLMKTSFVHTIREDVSQMLWIGTDAGLYRLKRVQGGYIHTALYRHNPANVHSLAADDVRSLCVDRTGTVWVGLFGAGINKYSPAGNFFRTYSRNVFAPSSLANNNVRSMYEDRAGTVWIGTSGGLNVCNARRR